MATVMWTPWGRLRELGFCVTLRSEGQSQRKSQGQTRNPGSVVTLRLARPLLIMSLRNLTEHTIKLSHASPQNGGQILAPILGTLSWQSGPLGVGFSIAPALK